MNAASDQPCLSLSNEQRAAIEHSGPLLVVAGAGSGKTTVLALRIAHLVTSGRCDPFQVLAVTFSVKAAHELRDRLSDLLAPEDARRMTVCTLHALGLRMLREHGDLLGYDLGADARQRKPSVVSPAESRALVAGAAKTAVADLRANGHEPSAKLLERMTLDELASAISQAKCAGVPPDGFAPAETTDPVRRAIADGYATYQRALVSANAVDFDDLILQPLMLLRTQPDALDFYRDCWQHVLVDEFQDVSGAQYEIVARLSAGHGQLTVIGDANQSVYGFRGAMGGEGFERFRRDFPSAAVAHLPHNFRSSANIVAVSTAVLGGQARQVAVKCAGLPVVLLRAGSEHEEATVIAQEIVRASACGFAPYEACAVLCRTNAQIPPIEQALLAARVPYIVIGRERGTFFDHAEVRHLLAYLTLSQDSLGDSYALRQIVNVPPRGLSSQAQRLLQGDAPELTVEHLMDSDHVAQLDDPARSGVRSLLDALYQLEQRRDLPPADLVDFILADDGITDDGATVGYGRYLTNRPDASDRHWRIKELRRMAHRFASVRDFLDEVDVMSGQDPLSSTGRDRVSVLTLHDAKGLEFRLVFLAGVEEGRLPHSYGQESRRGLEEERRLCYVGFSRATDALCLTFARTRDGRAVAPSRFLQGLPSALITRAAPAWAPAAAGGAG